MLVKQILASKPITGVETVAPDISVSAAVEYLSQRRIGAVVVSKDGKKIMGILSERDIVRELGRVGPSCLSMPVSEMMTKRIVTCSEDETADAILATMTDGRFRHVPVVSNNEMIGIISIGDVVKARLSELSMEKDALEHMIMGH